MVTARALFKVLLTAILLVSSPALAQSGPEADLHFIARYDFSWTDIPLAAAELSIDEDKTSYKLHLVLVSSGVVNLFTRHRSDTVTSGIKRDGRYLPRLYESHYWTKNKPRHIKLAFDEKGRVKEEIVEPPEDRTERAEVPHSLKDGAIDPLSVLRVMPSGVLKPQVFDAKHLWEGEASVMSTKKPISMGGHEVTGYVLSRRPIAGMTQKETVQYDKGEPPLNFYVSADARHIPIYMNLSLYLGMLRGRLTKECPTWDACRVN